MLDDLLIEKLRAFGYSLEFTDDNLVINRSIKVPLFIWAYIIIGLLFLIATSFTTTKIVFGVLMLLLIIILFFRNMAFEVIIDKKSATVNLRKGIFKVSKHISFNEIKSLELKTYDVPTSASPFEKTNREFIAEIRLLPKQGIPVDLMNFERRSAEEISFAKDIFEFKKPSLPDEAGLKL